MPDTDTLPTMDALLRANALDANASDDVIDLAALEAMVSLTPARAEPHDAAAWLPLPGDLGDLPGVEQLLAPTPEIQAAVVAAAEALAAEAAAAAEAVVAPSPARAEPHDAAAWLPLPDPDTLVPLTRLTPPDEGSAPGRPRWRRVLAASRSRSFLLVLLVCATVFAAMRIGGDPDTPATAGTAPFAVTVDLDGTITPVRTTARTAELLGDELDVGKLVAVRAAPRRLRDGAQVVLRTRRSGLLEVDGASLSFDSPSHTVAELLAAYDVSLDGDDTSSPEPDAVLADGVRVKVIRVGAATTQTEEPIPFGTEERPDPTIAIGTTREIQAGVDGVATVTSRARLENGVEVGRTVLSKVPSVEPVPRVIGFGTGADWRWDALANCESGGKWGTVDPGTPSYDGGLGILRENWVHYGGLAYAPNAGLATREQQILVAQKIYDQYGWEPWGCARGALGWGSGR